MTKNRHNNGFQLKGKFNPIQNYRREIGKNDIKKSEKKLNNVNNQDFNIPRFRVPQEDLPENWLMLVQNQEERGLFNHLTLSRGSLFFLMVPLFSLVSQYQNNGLNVPDPIEKNTLGLISDQPQSAPLAYPEVYAASVIPQIRKIVETQATPTEVKRNTNPKKFTFSNNNMSFEQVLRNNLDEDYFSKEQIEKIVKVFKTLPERTQTRLKNVMISYQNINNKPFIRKNNRDSAMEVGVNSVTQHLFLYFTQDTLELVTKADRNSAKLTELNVVLNHEIYHTIDGLVANAPNRTAAVFQKDVANYKVCKQRFDYTLKIFKQMLTKLQDPSLLPIVDILIDAKSPYLETTINVKKNSPAKTKQLFLKQVFEDLVEQFEYYQNNYSEICGDFFAVIGSALTKEPAQLDVVLNQIETCYHQQINYTFNTLTETRLGTWAVKEINKYEERFANSLAAIAADVQLESQIIRKEFSSVFSTQAVENILKAVFNNGALKNNLLKIANDNQKLKHHRPLFQSLEDIFVDEKNDLVVDLERFDQKDSVWNFCRAAYQRLFNNKGTFDNQYDFERCTPNDGNTYKVNVIGSRSGNPDHIEHRVNTVPVAPEVEQNGAACIQLAKGQSTNQVTDLQKCFPVGNSLSNFELNRRKNCQVSGQTGQVKC